ncbi:MAG: hypothetical protein C4526_02820 [Nitrospiraceae bacterium]|nr:MAG: hypothetical protein C4526_02820 [Nitrospiraceae bacterium]
MGLEIGKDILDSTDRCGNNFSCLSDKTCLCEIEDNFNGKVLFIKPQGRSACNYMMSFGYSYICNCPVRKEIFRRYQM